MVKKISDKQLIYEYIVKRKTLKEIVEEYGYSSKFGIATLSERLSQLKGHRYRDEIKLHRVGKSRTRHISIQSRMIEKAGFDPDTELVAKRRAEKGKIILELRTVE